MNFNPFDPIGLLPMLGLGGGSSGEAMMPSGPGGGLGFDPTQQDQNFQGLLSSLMMQNRPQSSGLYGGGQQSYLGGYGLI